MKARTKRYRPVRTCMHLNDVDISTANEALIIQALELQYQFKHPKEKPSAAICKACHIKRPAYFNAKAGRGHLGIVKLFEMQKLCESDLVTRFIASKQ